MSACVINVFIRFLCAQVHEGTRWRILQIVFREISLTPLVPERCDAVNYVDRALDEIEHVRAGDESKQNFQLLSTIWKTFPNTPERSSEHCATINVFPRTH